MWTYSDTGFASVVTALQAAAANLCCAVDMLETGHSANEHLLLMSSTLANKATYGELKQYFFLPKPSITDSVNKGYAFHVFADRHGREKNKIELAVSGLTDRTRLRDSS